MRLTGRIHHVWTVIRQHLADRAETIRNEPDAGYTTETVIVTALLVLAGIAALAVLGSKIADKVNSINL
ncbi:hypothetical protein [Kitasatospora viridis]|uniref:Uncharacterized protein n=1 Tax=Kitasatospora viridis TaxID=281105 RepID=A0A561TW04_9ACTN|nr:hypothetical protein [Kitasatospora viridis]TWF91290.1 hypothetical protein FHX73_12402 [Kitasatospora viridis]